MSKESASLTAMISSQTGAVEGRRARCPRPRPRRGTGRPVPPEYTEPTGSAPMTRTAPLETSFRYRPAPEIVPPVPTPATKWVSRPSVWRHSSGPVECVVRRGVLGVGVLVGLVPPVDLGGESVRDLVVAARVFGVDGRRADDDLGAVGAEHGDLVAAHLVRHHEHAPVAALLGDERESDAGVAARRLDDRAARVAARPTPRRRRSSARRCGPSPSRRGSCTRPWRAPRRARRRRRGGAARAACSRSAR